MSRGTSAVTAPFDISTVPPFEFAPGTPGLEIPLARVGGWQSLASGGRQILAKRDKSDPNGWLADGAQ